MTGSLAPYPADFGLELDGGVRCPSPGVLIGGSPLRVMRLTTTGSGLVDSWEEGSPVGPGRAEQQLARRLVDAGVAHPRPPAAVIDGVDVAIVIPVRDDRSGLESTLASLSAHAYAGSEIVVVDDGSLHPARAGSAQLVRQETPRGPAAARNTGWRSVGADYIVFLDAGCVASPGWLDTILAHLGDPAVAAVAPRIRATHGTGRTARYEQRRSPLDMGPRRAQVRPGGAVPYVPTACLAIRRHVLERCGGFDEDLRYGEDVDLVWRLEGAGCVVRYEPAAIVSHPSRSGTAAWLRQRFHYGTSAADLAERHGTRVAPLAVSPWSAAVWALVAGGRPLAGAAVAAGTTAAVARRAGGDAATTRSVARFAALGNLRAGAWIATAVRRAWLPLLVAAMVVPVRRWRRRGAISLAACFALPALEWWGERPAVDPLTWVLLRWADDLAYQTGLWVGITRRRSLRSLRPRWSGVAKAQSPAASSSSDSPVSR